MNENETATSVDVEAGQPVHINLEGIKLNGVSQEDAARIAEEAAKQAFAFVEASYRDTITQLESLAETQSQQLKDALEERDQLRAEKAERERHAAFVKLFDEFAVAGEARDALYQQAFNGMGVEQARSVLKHFGVIKPAKEQEDDVDVPPIKEKTELLDDPVALGRQIAEQLMPQKAQN